MSRCQSPRCAGARVTPPARLCPGCRDEVRARLAELPGLYAACEEALTPTHGWFAQRSPRRRPAGATVSLAAVGARADMLSVLASWCGLVAAERPVRPPRRREVRYLVPFLLGHLDWLAAHPAAGSLHAEVGELALAARAVLDDAEAPASLGRCIRPECGQPVRVWPGTPPRVCCAAGHAFAAHEWLRLAGPAWRQERSA
jgi:hypothetical protein